MKIRVTDYIAKTLAAHGIKHVFMVTGGGAMHLNDAFGRCREMEYICCHHEQACAMAAESYFRLSGKLAAVNVTTGPGGINALNGVFGAYTDSLGMIVISGQVKFETTIKSTSVPLRQLGDQEVDIVRMAEGITKYAVMVTEPESIRYHLEKALFLATEGRPGPVWLDIPMNVQGALIEEDALEGFTAPEADWLRGDDLDETAKQILDKLFHAKRPVIMAGTGVRISGAQKVLLQFADRAMIPIVTAFNAHDLVPDSHPSYAGRPSTVGDRAGNFTVQNADVLLVLGCRLNIRQVSYNWENFAKNAFKIVVDIDALELQKPTVKPDLPIHADAKELLERLLELHPAQLKSTFDDTCAYWDPRELWIRKCQEWRRRYPVVLPEYRHDNPGVNPYAFMEKLFENLVENDIIVCGDGTACVVSGQAANIKNGQRIFTNSGSASMGYDLPASIGAYIAAQTYGSKPEHLICLAGDGSIMMNLQELQTIITHQLPVKIFLLNNRGYHSIRQTQQNYFADNIVGCGTESGLSFPDFSKLAPAFGFQYECIRQLNDAKTVIPKVLSDSGAVICETILDLGQQFSPKLASRKLEDGTMVSSSLEDMAPFLSREELAANMIATHI